MDNNTELASAPIKKLLFKLALPTVFAQLINLLYNIVDRMYVGHIENVGSMALAGLGVCFPIIILISAFAALVGMGGAPRASMAYGAGDLKGAKKVLGTAAAFLVIISIVLTVFFWFTMEPILLMFGASETTLPFGLSYLRIYLLGTMAVQLSLGLNQFISAQGFATRSMTAVLIGAVTNIILDPIMIFVFDMGVSGAAIATIISQTISAIYIVSFLCSKKAVIRFERKYLRLDRKVLTSIIMLGIGPFIMQSTECLIQLVFNIGMKNYGGDYYVSVMAILFSLNQVMFLPMQGISMGGVPIISYNYGAGNMDRVKEAFKLMLKVSLIYSAVFTSLFLIAPRVFIMLFSSDAEVIRIGAWAMRIYMFGFIFMGIQMACQQTFLAVGQSKISVFLALLRKVILLTPLALIMPRFFGVTGLLFAEPISDILAISITAITFAVSSKKIFDKEYAKKQLA